MRITFLNSHKTCSALHHIGNALALNIIVEANENHSLCSTMCRDGSFHGKMATQ